MPAKDVALIALFLVIIVSCLGFLLLTVSVLIRCYLAVVTVENVSMSPTLEPGDRVLVVRRWPNKWLRRGDIVLVWPSRTSSIGPTLFEVKPYIKRIIGLGEEALTISLDEIAQTNYPRQQDAADHLSQQVWHIPQGYIFVRGDNRPGSLDSLAWGPIPLQSVLGMVLMKLPRKAFSSLPSSDSLPFDEVPTFGLPAGQVAPPFVAQTLSGETVMLTTYTGQPVIFFFIAPITRCREIISLCSSLAPKVAGITIVFVSATAMQPIRPFVDELNISLPVLVAPRTSNPFLHDYKILGTPAYCFINEEGKVQSSGFLNMRQGAWKVLTELLIGHEIPMSEDVY